MLAVDEGGPTRAFLSQVWRQMDNLKVQSNGKQAALFERSELGFCKPQTNEVLQAKLGLDGNAEEVCGLVRPFYRALGRIMLYCLSQKITIATLALPELYRNYLLRGIDPTDERYDLHELVDHVSRLVNLKHKEGDCQDAIRRYFEGVECEGELDHNTFRSSIKEMFVDGRSMALDALKEGLSLGGEYSASSYRAVWVDF